MQAIYDRAAESRPADTALAGTVLSPLWMLEKPFPIPCAVSRCVMFDVEATRRQFPALQRRMKGQSSVFLDGPGGTQVPQRVIDAMVHYLTAPAMPTTAASSRQVGSPMRILHEAHQAAADLLNAPSADEIVFGQNMTTLTFHLSRAFGRTLKPGDEVLVTRLDHDANVSPWVLAARDAGATVRFVDIHPEDCTLDLDDLQRQLDPRRSTCSP